MFLDDTLDFKEHTKRNCQTAMLSYFKIKCMRKYLTKEATEVLCLSFVISHLDYCNVILYGISQTELAKLQHIQNMCAKLMHNSSRYDSSKHSLNDLLWLPIKARINFKILTYMYNCSVGNGPQYLSELLTYKVSKHTLRSSESAVGCYEVPYNRKKTFSDRSLALLGLGSGMHYLWNLDNANQWILSNDI